jgi:hypothetical protein
VPATARSPFSKSIEAQTERQTNKNANASRPRESILFPARRSLKDGVHLSAPWITIPALEDHCFHRYDLLKIKMQMENPIQPVLEQVAAAPQSGNRVWLVGGEIRLDGAPPPDLRPAPNNPWGWLDEPYSHIWGAKVGHFIANHATQGTNVFEPLPNCNSFENLSAVMIAGWRSTPPSTQLP